MYDFLSIGTASRDIFMNVPDGKILEGPPGTPVGTEYLGFEYGSKIVCDDALFTFGGGAYNSATSLTKMGFKVAAGIRIGRDATGDALIGELKEAGVACRYMERDDTKHTGMSFVVVVPHADHVLFKYPGAGAGLALPALSDAATRAMYVTSLGGEHRRLIAEIAAKAESQNLKLFFNPGKKQIKNGYEALSDLIKNAYVMFVNRSEALDLVRSYDPEFSDHEVPILLRKIHEWGPDICVITDGRAGAFAYDGSNVYYQASFPAETLDTTGAGDSFGAAFAAGLLQRDGDIAGALRLGAANAASVVTRMSSTAGALTLEAADKLADKYPFITAEILR